MNMKASFETKLENMNPCTVKHEVVKECVIGQDVVCPQLKQEYSDLN